MPEATTGVRRGFRTILHGTCLVNGNHPPDSQLARECPVLQTSRFQPENEGTPHQLSRRFSPVGSSRNLSRDDSLGGSSHRAPGVMGIVEGPGLEHRDQDPQEPVRHAAQGAAVRVAPAAVFSVRGGAPLVMHHTDAGPVIDRLPETAVAGVTHHDLFALPTLVRYWGDPGVSPQGVVVALGQGLSGFGEHRGGNPTAHADQRPEDLSVAIGGARSLRLRIRTERGRQHERVAAVVLGPGHGVAIAKAVAVWR
jgi:hypothetical protein